MPAARAPAKSDDAVRGRRGLRISCRGILQKADHRGANEADGAGRRIALLVNELGSVNFSLQVDGLQNDQPDSRARTPDTMVISIPTRGGAAMDRDLLGHLGRWTLQHSRREQNRCVFTRVCSVHQSWRHRKRALLRACCASRRGA